MPRYQLVAARDGDIVNEIAEWPSEAVAEAWAFGVLALEFRLDPEQFSAFEKIAPETDGCTLEALDDDPIAVASIALLRSLHPMIAKVASTPLLGRDRYSVAVIGRMADLALCLQEEGYTGRYDIERVRL